ncbi:MFS transporter [Cytophagaceae bacterium YF14B1]|uniref:MFS transporter n=1 Tax=Xanthocytophaga flava TaxID=3048013 RepID=A0AAE3U7Y5_9BACT|nr:MFS transporter [Xanthocytophaga flavus]MDJ1480094.1 MFS transporter [Xanthocytophaga flavus]
MSITKEQTKTGTHPQFFILVTVFFFWGFVAAANDILIPVFKKFFDLEQWQAQLVSFAFYIAYTVGSIIYLLISKALKADLLNKIGYKNGIAIGLLISGFGALIFYPAAQANSYALLLTGLFVVGLGFSLQQTAAQPFAILLGDPNSGSQRVNFAGGINNFGTTLGPILVSYAIFGSISSGAGADATVDSVKTPYLILGALFFFFAVFFWLIKLPSVTQDVPSESGFAALKYPQLVLGMIAIFLYVGAEVTIGSNLGEYLRVEDGLREDELAPYVSLFWASLMIGRWTAGVSVFNPSPTMRKVLTVVVPYIAFGVYLLINFIRGTELTPLYIYSVCVLAIIIAFFISQDKPAKMLLTFASFGAIATIIGILGSGKIALYALISGGMFCSVLWPCIFTLAIAGLGKNTPQGSAFLIMMIMGGGFVSMFQSWLSGSIGIQQSYWVPVVCFVYLAWYAARVKGILKSQGIDYESASTSGSGH